MRNFLIRFLQILVLINLVGKFLFLFRFFAKVVGIFLDLDDEVILRLINDDHYFNTQVAETIKVNFNVIFSN